MKTHLPFSRRDRRAFTLVEVILAVAVLVLLTGGLFGTVRGTMRAAAALRDEERVRQGVYGLFELCGRTFPALPAGATVMGGALDGGQVLTVRGAPEAFRVGGGGPMPGEAAMEARRQPDGTLTLGIAYRSADPRTGRLSPATWLPLLPELERVEWTFYDAGTGAWREAWRTGQRPALVRLAVFPAGEDREWTRTFWLPAVAAAPGAL